MRSQRQRRIDRALSSVLRAIDAEQDAADNSCETWAQYDRMSARMNTKRVAAYDRANALDAQWSARIAKLRAEEEA
jgi:hypothetical protein